LKTFKQFIINEYHRSLTQAEVQEIRDREGIKFSTDKGHPTQRANTISTYAKFYELVQKRLVTIGRDEESLIGLDYSSGLGLGAETIRLAGGNIESYEPFPHENSKDITYAGLNSLPSDKKYDYIINSVVLNVVEQDIRDGIVLDIWDHLKAGGIAIIGVRSKADVLGAKSAYVIDEENGEIIDTIRGSYQKGFTSEELRGYLIDMLPDAIVMRNTGFSQIVCIIYKEEEWITDEEL